MKRLNLKSLLEGTQILNQNYSDTFLIKTNFSISYNALNIVEIHRLELNEYFLWILILSDIPSSKDSLSGSLGALWPVLGSLMITFSWELNPLTCCDWVCHTEDDPMYFLQHSGHTHIVISWSCVSGKEGNLDTWTPKKVSDIPGSWSNLGVGSQHVSAVSISLRSNSA